MATNLAVAVRVGLNKMFSLSLSLRNVAFEGTLRVELSPLVPVMPCFGNMSICLIEVPDINFDVFIGECVAATIYLCPITSARLL